MVLLSMQDDGRRGPPKSRENQRRVGKAGTGTTNSVTPWSAAAVAAAAAAGDTDPSSMAPHRGSPSPPRLEGTRNHYIVSSSSSGSSTSGDSLSVEERRTIEPLPEAVAKPSREEIFSFPHSKRVGSYILGRTLGEGAFAKVKEGRHLLTGEKVSKAGKRIL